MFLVVALLTSLVIWYLPQFLNLSAYRPQIVDYLTHATQCSVLIGNVRAQIVPQPGLVVDHVVFLDNAGPRLLASVRVVQLSLSWDSLRQRRLVVRTIRLIAPRVIIHREPTSSGENQWVWLIPPPPQTKSSNSSLLWELRKGSLEVWDHTRRPMARWTAEQLSGTYQSAEQTAQLTARVPSAGPHSLLTLHYDAAQPMPVQATLSDVKLDKMLRPYFPGAQDSWLDGSTALTIKAQIHPALRLHISAPRFQWARLPNRTLRIQAVYEPSHLQAELTTGATSSMALSVEAHSSGKGWNASVRLRNYEAPLVRRLYRQRWVDPLEGPGTVTAFFAQAWGTPGLRCSARGENFTWKDTAFRLPHWTLEVDPQAMAVNALALSEESGGLDVSWSKPWKSPDSALDIVASSVTVRQVLEIFALQAPKAALDAAGDPTPYGYERLRINAGTVRASLHPQMLELQESNLTVDGMALQATGQFGTGAAAHNAQVSGRLNQMAVGPLLRHFWRGTELISGAGNLESL